MKLLRFRKCQVRGNEPRTSSDRSDFYARDRLQFPLFVDAEKSIIRVAFLDYFVILLNIYFEKHCVQTARVVGSFLLLLERIISNWYLTAFNAQRNLKEPVFCIASTLK